MSTRFADTCELILLELGSALAAVDARAVDGLLEAIHRAGSVFVVGAGRMGILLSTFSMRLNHLGFCSHIVGSATCPPISPQDLLLVASSSGETATVREVVARATEEKATVAVITATPRSTIGRMASHVLVIQAPSSLESLEEDARMSKQPMKTLFEQTLFLLLEALVILLLEQTGQTSADISRRHANLE